MLTMLKMWLMLINEKRTHERFNVCLLHGMLDFEVKSNSVERLYTSITEQGGFDSDEDHINAGARQGSYIRDR